MKLTPAEQVRKGFWFVRRITGEDDLGRDSWAIGVIRGEFPFLTGTVIAYADDVNSFNMDKLMRRQYYEITNPNEWEFAGKIEFPSEEINENKL